MDSRSLFVLVAAVAAAAFTAVVINAVNSELIALAAFFLLPLLWGSFAGIMSLPGRAGVLLVLLSIVAFFVAGALVSSGDTGNSLGQEIAIYGGLGLFMGVFGLVSFVGMSMATSSTRDTEADSE